MLEAYPVLIARSQLLLLFWIFISCQQINSHISMLPGISIQAAEKWKTEYNMCRGIGVRLPRVTVNGLAHSSSCRSQRFIHRYSYICGYPPTRIGILNFFIARRRWRCGWWSCCCYAFYLYYFCCFLQCDLLIFGIVLIHLVGAWRL